MSYHFTIKHSTPLSAAELLRMIARDDVEFLEQQGEILRVWIPGKSTRYTDVTFKNNEFDVCTYANASAADYELGARIAYVIGEHAGQAVNAEFLGEVSLDQFNNFNSDWATANETAGFESFIRFFQSRAESLTIPCPLGEYIIGARLMAELNRGCINTGELGQRIKESMLAFNNPAINHATKFQTELSNRTLAFWYPYEDVILPKVDSIVMVSPTRELLFEVPWGNLLEVAVDHAHLMDEEQPLIRAFSIDEAPLLRARAQAVGEPVPKELTKSRTKSWWQFWK